MPATAAATAVCRSVKYVAVSYFTDSFDGKVINLLKKGGVGLLPTDTIYGLSAAALNQPAVKRISRLKGRETNQQFIVLISNLEMLDLLSIPKVPNYINNLWPGPLSIILTALSAPNWLSPDGKSIAVRWPDYPALQNLIDKTGPLISTSANFHGQEPTATAKAAQAIFGDNLDFYVDAGRLTSQPSTLAALNNGRLEILRQGAVKIRAEE